MPDGPAGALPPTPRKPPREWLVLLCVLAGLALVLALSIGALVHFLRPVSPAGEFPVPGSGKAPPPVNPDARLVATDLYLGADDFVVDVFHNGQRVPETARRMTAEVYGAIGERVSLPVREGDWLVFNVVNNRLRWGGVHYFGAGGVGEDASLAFVSEESPQWSVCEEPGEAPRFIAEPGFQSDRPVRRIEKPWSGGDKMISSKVPGWNGHAIWGDPTNRNIWLKFRVPYAR